MGPRTRLVLAWALWLVTFGCCAAGLLVTLAITRPLTLAVLAEGAVYAFFFVLGFATVGLVLSLRRPGNPIGWLYGAAGLAWAYAIPFGPWVDKLLREHRPLPFVAQVVVASGDLSWAPAIALGITLPALLLPNGRLRSRRWRLVVASSVTGAVLATLAGPLSPGPLEEAGIDNPLGLGGPAGKVAAVLTIAGIVLHWLSLPPAAVCVVLRFRSSRGVERQQMRWVAAGVAGAVAGLLLGLPSGLGFLPNYISCDRLPGPALPAGGDRGGGAPLPAVRPGPGHQPHPDLRAADGPARPGLRGAGARARAAAARGLQPGRGRRHPGRGGAVPAAAPPGPAAGRPALQPPPL